ncbi:MAG: hypothetical protein FJ297_01140 [Planctomycetes bacterium]|nr:hypothetical protein [Planctomycetota bacterium]
MSNHDLEIASAVWIALADRFGPEPFALYFGGHAAIDHEADRIIVTVADPFRAERLQRTHRAAIEAVVRETVGAETRVEFRVDADRVRPNGADATPARAPDSRSSQPCGRAIRRSVASGLDTNGADGRVGGPASNGQRAAAPSPDSQAFLAFMLGEEHGVASASLDMVLRQPGKVTPFFVHGPTGCGKTHFLDHVRREARRRAGIRRVVGVSAEQFTAQFLEALQGKGMPSFRRKFREVDLLLIDDLQFFNGKKQTLGELQATIDYLIRERRQLVLAADRSPYELAAFHAGLAGRLRGGVVCELPYPGFEARRGIVEQVAREHGGLPRDVVDWIAERFAGDARRIAGAVYRLVATRHATGKPLDTASAESALLDLVRAPARAVRLADIDEAVCDLFGLDRASLHADNRCKRISQPRMLAMWLARKHTRAGVSEICRHFGKRSHSTVVSAERQVKRWLDRNDAVRLVHGELPIEDAIRRIESQLRTG